MNPQQNQNTQPDYGFIVNQQSPQPKKKLSKLKIMFGVLILLGLMSILIFIFVSPQNNVEKAENQQAEVIATSHEDATDKFMALMGEKPKSVNAEAVKLICGDLYVNDTVNVLLLQRLADSIDFKNCSRQQNNTDSANKSEEQDSTYKCTTFEGENVTFVLVTKNFNANGYKIIAHKVIV